jgi:hypothetical protein
MQRSKEEGLLFLFCSRRRRPSSSSFLQQKKKAFIFFFFVTSCARAKAKREWNHLVALAKECPPLPKPPLVKLASEPLLKVLGLNAWGVGNVP